MSSAPSGPKRASDSTVRGRLLQLAMRCLEKDPRVRFASGRELLVALTEAESGKRESKRPARTRESTQPPGRRRATHYANADGVHVAYQVIGSGPVDLCFVAGFVSNLDVWWEQAPGRDFFSALAARTRLIMFDKRGSGLSDRVPNQTLDGRVEDLRAVLDAVGSQDTVIFGDAGATLIRFAARYPERTRALILYGTTEKSWRAGAQARDLLVGGWGTGVSLPIFAPSLTNDPIMQRWGARWERLSVSPGSLLSLIDAMQDIDVTEDARVIRVPTLVIHRSGDRTIPPEAGRVLAALIPGAKYSEHEGIDHAPMIGDGQRIVEEVLGFVDAHAARRPARV